MNFEPCNPPLIDPLYLSRVTLRTDVLKLISLRQQDLKIRLCPEKSSQIRPVPVTLHSSTISSLSPQPTSPTFNSRSTSTSYNFTPNVTISSAPTQVYGHSCFRPVPDNVTTSQSLDISIRETSVQKYTAPVNSPVQSSITSANLRKISPVQSSITSANLRKISPVQSSITSANSKKISPVQYLKKSPRSAPNSRSTSTSYNFTPNVTISSAPTQVSGHSCFRPVPDNFTTSQSLDISPQVDVITDISREASARAYTAPVNSPVQSSITPACPRKISPAQSSITSANLRKISPVQYSITSANSRTISPVQYLKKSPRSAPNSRSTSTSYNFTPNVTISSAPTQETSVQAYNAKSPVQSNTEPANSRKISPVQSYTTPANSRKISPPDSTSVANKSDRRINGRHEISEFQSYILKKWFNSYTYLTKVKKTEVSKDTGLPEKTVMYWFQNQRTKVKRETSVKS